MTEEEFKEGLGAYMDPEQIGVDPNGNQVFISFLKKETAEELGLLIYRMSEVHQPERVTKDPDTGATAVLFTTARHVKNHKLGLVDYSILIAHVNEPTHDYVVNISIKERNVTCH